MRVPFYARLIVLATLCAAGAAGAYAARVRYLPAGVTLPGLRIDGERVPEGADLRAFVAGRARALLDRRVSLRPADDGSRVLFQATLAELGVRVDEEQVVAIAARVGRDEDLLGRAQTAERARRGEIDVPLAMRVDDAILAPIIERLKEAEDVQPISARLDLEHHGTIPERPGRYLDAFGVASAVEAAARDPRAEVALVPVSRVAPRVTSAFVSRLDVSTVLSDYETYFSRAGDQSRRGKNIDVAAAKLDGLVLSPGELTSFNAVVGDRSEENGFQKSWEIFKGEMVEGIGGGTCQVASTFHAVAFFSGLEVVERLPHSRPSAYIPMGLDSTVVYPIVDLKVRNPYPFPIVLHTKTEGNKLRMELLGPSRPARVAFGRDLIKTVPYPRKVVEKPWLHGAKVVVKQHGIRGFRIKRKRLITFVDGTLKREENTDYYPPTTEIYEVPVGFDVSLLPQLPSEDGDDGEGSDSSAQVASSAAAVAGQAGLAVAAAVAQGTVAALPSACTSDCVQTASSPAPLAPSAPELQMVDAPGAHAPTAAQANPAKSMWVKH